MSSTIQVKITLSGIAANKLLYVLIIYPTNSGPEMLFLLLKALISISSPFSPVSSPTNSSQSDNPLQKLSRNFIFYIRRTRRYFYFRHSELCA